MLRHKKHKRLTDGLGSGVGVMDDTDQEVSSFTDRAFRSLCVAEEEPLNDINHLPSPIRGMPLSTKYHLGIFNLSVRKTQPLAQLPILPGHRGKWAPTFQPLLNRHGYTEGKTNMSKICAPEPRGFKQRSKVSSLIKTFDNIENEVPESSPSRLILSVASQKGNPPEEGLYVGPQKDPEINVLESSNPGNLALHENIILQRRTARDVFLESQAEMGSKPSGSPHSLESSLDDSTKKITTQKEPARKTSFLHSENSAFKSWSDINKRMIGGDEKESSLPGTPPMMKCPTPCSPLLSRTKYGVWTREAGLELGWSSPASSVSSSYDPGQVLRSVPPLPTKRHGKQPKETRTRLGARIPPNARNQEDDMQVDTGSPSFKDQLNSTRLPIDPGKSKSPQIISQEKTPCEEPEVVPVASHSHTEDVEKVQEKTVSPQLARKYEVKDKDIDERPAKEHVPPQGRIKTLIHQMEKETSKDFVPPHLVELEHKPKELPRDDAAVTLPAVTLPAVTPAESLNSNPVPHGVMLIPPWRRGKVNQKVEVEEKILASDSTKRESATNPINVNMPSNEDISIGKPTSTSFNITSLLTPVIRRKNIKEALEEHPMVITPPPAETIITKEQDAKDISLHSNRNDYKSKATSLMFNIKDMRKRVKSTYSPATSGRNGNDNHMGESKEQSNHRIALMDISKWVMDRENNTLAPVIHSPRVAGGNENKTNSLASVADNYLSLSSPQQAIECSVTENGEAEPEAAQTEERIPDENMTPDRLHHIEHNIRKGEDYPSLNLYPKEQTSPELNAEILPDQTPMLLNVTEEQHLPDKITEDLSPNDTVSKVVEVSPTPDAVQPENNIDENIQSHQLQSFPCQDMDIQRDSKSEEDGIQEESGENAKEELQYYAVSSCAMEESAERDVLETETEKMAEVKEEKESEKQMEETVHVEEIERPASGTMFRPALFRIKDNTIKPCPVTRSVRMPLMRSMSEESLAYRKEPVSHFEDNKQKILDDKVMNSIAANNNIAEMEISRKGNIRQVLTMRPASEISKPISSNHNHIKKQREERYSLELWNKLSSLNEQWRKVEEHKPETENIKENPLEGAFFHQVETCVSEVTGPSPECNTLMMHNASESINDMINEDLRSPSLQDADNMSYSALDGSLVHFEDAVTLSEDIACSTITSPMSESVTCSMVTSPMSINSSGFTTALSCFEDFPSPTSSSVNSRNGKFTFPPPEKSTSALPEIIENEKTECYNNSKEEFKDMEHLKMQSAKPPAVPPKTEKALRRAKRLTKKRRKTDLFVKTPDGELSESDLILDVPSPRTATPNSLIHQSHHRSASCIPKVIQPEGSITASSTPSFSATQRKLLQDPDSGQYFVVDIPVHFRVKTFYDPETGKYLQVSLPPSERETPTLDALNNQFILYPGLPPVPISSISSLKDLSHHLDNGAPEKGDRTKSWNSKHEEDEYPKEQRYIDSICDSCDQSMAGTPHSMDRLLSRSRSPDIISIRDLDDFAMEAIS